MSETTEQSRNPSKIDLPETPEAAETTSESVSETIPDPIPNSISEASTETESSASPAAEANPDAAPVGAAAAKKALEERIVEAIETVYDPEIPVNIYALGLIYGVDVQDDFDVQVKMTLTSPACPVAGSLPGEVEQKVKSVSGVRSAEVELVWDPAWNPDMMSEAAKLELGMF